MGVLQAMYRDSKLLHYFDIVRQQSTDFDLFRQDISKSFDILDLGCGQGSLAVFLAPLVKSVDGVDLSPEMISLANQKKSKMELANVDFVVGDMYHINPKKRYDCVVMGNSVLSDVNGIENQVALFEKIRSCLNKSGKLLFTIVLLDNSMFEKEYLKREITDPETNNKFSIRYENQLDLATSCWKTEIIINDFFNNHEHRVQYQASLYTRNEILLLLKFMGFKIVRETGSSGWMKYFSCEMI
ncbi:MAG: class I SAM-dependent methyltransferase [Deltaproteobacteria bacterium]|nr:class I SAM-dependent methyltransferase [Deltaproteobacteria bacterium]